ncbi:MAG: sigma-70 family RNA polymerase sigma factor [Bacteroidetes bacterium]|jgi:RNA polymerase sigma factor (TIGR02999 family)|nr:sigma-70 family RNA polymerase sigma factor [Bacteroidota bacterium]
MANVTQLLVEFQEGNPDAADRLWSEVYDELRRIAHYKLRHERSSHTMSTTALVHEAYLKLIDQSQVEWEDRLHFFAMSSRIMRNILIDYARRRSAQKRGGDRPHVQLDDAIVSAEKSAHVFLALDEALKQLTELDERLGRVVEYRFFGGMQEQEIAELLGVSKRTVRRDWRKAKGWLSRALADNAAPSESTD